MSKTTSFLTLFSVLNLPFVGCARPTPPHSLNPQALPASWHGVPEDHSAQPDSMGSGGSIEIRDEGQLGSAIEGIFSANAEALNRFQEPPGSNPLGAMDLGNHQDPHDHPKDWAPWHMEYFMTDFGISVSGLFAGLLGKGSPAVSAIWRKQYPKSTLETLDKALREAPHPEGASDIVISPEMTRDDLHRQIEPAIRAAMATGRIENENLLRKNLEAEVTRFQSWVSGFEDNPGSPWWISRFRWDVAFDAGGKITPAIGIGAEVKLRFEWHRIMRPHADFAANAGSHHPTPGIGTGLQAFVREMARDLEDASMESNEISGAGFKAYSFRAGVGVSAKGDIGLAKASGSVMGQIYFSRDVAKPVVNPKPSSHPLLAAESSRILLIDDAKNVNHLQYAIRNHIPFHPGSGDDGQVVYEVDRSVFKKGLQKAVKLGAFFAKHAAKAKPGTWKIFEVRTAFDVSLGGKLGLVEVAGLGTAEINFYNTKF